MVGTNEKAIVEATVELLENASSYARMARSVNPYGDGQASQRIVKAIFDASNISVLGLGASPATEELVLESQASGS